MVDDGTTLEEQDFNRRVDEFEKELQELQLKHRILLIPALKITPAGIVPQNNYVNKDTVDQAVAKQQLATTQPLKG